MATYTSSDEESTHGDSSPSSGRPPGAVSDYISTLSKAHTLRELQQGLDNIRFLTNDPSIAALAQQAAQTVRELQQSRLESAVSNHNSTKSFFAIVDLKTGYYLLSIFFLLIR